jgi:mRNA interferase RelE/StbE
VIGHYGRIYSTWQPSLSDARNLRALSASTLKAGNNDWPFQVCGSHQALGRERHGRLSASLFDRIAEAVLRLETDPRPNGSRKLRGTDGYRIRVGTYRVLYTVNDDTRIVEVIAVGHRRDVYR